MLVFLLKSYMKEGGNGMDEQKQNTHSSDSETFSQSTYETDDFETTYFPRRDRSNTVFYGQQRKQNLNIEQDTDTTQSIPNYSKSVQSEHIRPEQISKRIETKENPESLSARDMRRSGLNTLEKQEYKKSMDMPKPRRTEKKRKRRLTGGFKLFLVILIAFGIAIGCFQFMKSLMITDGGTENYTGETVMVTIPAGASTADIASILKENHLISSTMMFRLSSKVNGYDGTYQQGTYDIDTGMTDTQIMALLQTGSVQEQNKITIPEGFSVTQIAQRVEEKGICTAEEFMTEVNTGVFPHAFLKDIPEREIRLEGYLFPDTYFLSDTITAHELISMMLDRFEQMYTQEYQNAVSASGYTLDEIVTIASMIEKEIAVEEERPRAAGVIYNRLAADMTLGIDATVLYAVGKSAGELTQEDLQTDSPYNTRLNKGLPLGPITNPGESSFRAALYPEENEYLYYVVESAGQSNHVFCVTYEEFLEAKQKYQDSLAE